MDDDALSDRSSVPPATEPDLASQYEPPPSIQCGINFRIGDPSKTCREIKRIRNLFNGVPEVAFLPEGDTLGVLVERIKTQLTRIRFPGETYDWPSCEVYLKQFYNSRQGSFQQLDDLIVHESIQQGWRNEAGRLKRDDGIVVQLFVYLTIKTSGAAGAGGNRAGGSTIHRGTASRYQAATQAIDAHNEMFPSKAVPAPLARQFLARELSPNPDRISPPGEPLQIPTSVTYLQAESLDVQREELRGRRQLQRSVPQGSFVIEAQIDGTEIKLPLRLSLDVLREALGLPNCNLAQGLQRLSDNPPVPPLAPEQDMEDVDHVGPDAEYRATQRLLDQEEEDEEEEPLVRRYRTASNITPQNSDAQVTDDSAVDVDRSDSAGEPEAGPSSIGRKRKPAQANIREEQHNSRTRIRTRSSAQQ